jgi:uncharacterized membrane protein YfcA
MTITNAAASSLVSVAIFGAATSLNYAASGFVDWRLVGLLLAGGVIGGAAGLMVAKRFETRSAALRRAFAALVILVALYVAWRAVAAF